MEKEKKYPNRLKEIMDERGVRQSDMVKISGLSTNTVRGLYHQNIIGSAATQGAAVTGLNQCCKSRNLSDRFTTKEVFPIGTLNNPVLANDN